MRISTGSPRVQTHSHFVATRGQGFTLVELLVVIGIIALLVSILLPTLGRVRSQARRTQCATNLRSIGQACFNYAAQNKGSLPMVVMRLGTISPAATDEEKIATSVGSWLWDTQRGQIDLMTKGGGLQKSQFYCPSSRMVESDMVDAHWEFPGEFAPLTSYRVLGYVIMIERGFSYTGPAAAATFAINQRGWDQVNRMKTTEGLKRRIAPYKVTNSVLAADATISVLVNNTDSYGGVTGGLSDNSNHLVNGKVPVIPVGANVLGMDGHVEWRTFSTDAARSEIKLRWECKNGQRFWF